jgi:hypothetical protein
MLQTHHRRSIHAAASAHGEFIRHAPNASYVLPPQQSDDSAACSKYSYTPYANTQQRSRILDQLPSVVNAGQVSCSSNLELVAAIDVGLKGRLK